MVACCKKEQVMSETKRKNFTGEFKAKVALEAIRGVPSAEARVRHRRDADGFGRG